MLRIVSLGVLASSLALFSSCSKGGGDEDSGGSGRPTSGCIQGVILDGLTGLRVTIPAAADGVGIYVLVQDDLKRASVMTNDPAAAAHLQGEYHLCGLPLDQTYPMFVWLPGYAPFESLVEVESTRASRSPEAAVDIVKPSPSALTNIMVYPQSQQTKDLEFFVLHNGVALKDAQVSLRPTGGNFLDPGGLFFLPASNVRQKPLVGTTNEEGKVVFAAADLVLGGKYTYVVLPPNGGANQNAEVSAGVFIVGLRDGSDVSDPYRIFVDLEHTGEPLAELSRSTDNNDPIADGTLNVYFNRAIELVPGTPDGIAATLSGADKAELVANTPGNDKAEQVEVTITGNLLTLKPKWKTQPAADPKDELSLAIYYSGIVVRPTGVPDTLSTVNVDGVVNFYQ
jgi:hypothetical protein